MAGPLKFSRLRKIIPVLKSTTRELVTAVTPQLELDASRCHGCSSLAMDVHRHVRLNHT